MSLQYPNVPQLPGVPQVVRSAAAVASEVILTTAIIGNILSQASVVVGVWGIFDSSDNLALAPDSIREFNTRSEWRVANFPIQQGAFASYNKVAVPPEYLVQMVKGGALSDRQQFEAALDAVAASLALYTIVTPEKSYLNCNVTRFEKMRKGAPNAYFTVVDLFFIQIVQVTAQYSSTANASLPAALPNAPQGTISAQPPSPSVVSPLATVGIQ